LLGQQQVRQGVDDLGLATTASGEGLRSFLCSSLHRDVDRPAGESTTTRPMGGRNAAASEGRTLYFGARCEVQKAGQFPTVGRGPTEATRLAGRTSTVAREDGQQRAPDAAQDGTDEAHELLPHEA
jgi:hypothetical protein